MMNRIAIPGLFVVTRFVGTLSVHLSSSCCAQARPSMRCSGGTWCWQTCPAPSIVFQFGVRAQYNYESKAQGVLFPSVCFAKYSERFESIGCKPDTAFFPQCPVKPSLGIVLSLIVDHFLSRSHSFLNHS